MSQEMLIEEVQNSDFARVVGQAAVAFEISNPDSKIKREEVCTTMRHGAKLGAALVLEALSQADVRFDVSDIEEATQIAVGMNRVDVRGDN